MSPATPVAARQASFREQPSAERPTLPGRRAHAANEVRMVLREPLRPSASGDGRVPTSGRCELCPGIIPKTHHLLLELGSVSHAIRVHYGAIKANVDGRPSLAARSRYCQVLRASSPRQAVGVHLRSSGSGALGIVDTAQALIPPRQEDALDLVPAGRLQVTQPRRLTALDLREAPLCRQRGSAAGSEGFPQSILRRRRQEETHRSCGAVAPVKSKALQRQPETTVKVAFRQDHELRASEPVLLVVRLAQLVEEVRVGLVLPVRFQC